MTASSTKTTNPSTPSSGPAADHPTSSPGGCELCTLARAYVAEQGIDVVILCLWCGEGRDR